MVLWRGRRGFVSVLWCVTPVSFDRVHPRAVTAKKTRQAAQHVFCFALLSVSYVVRADVCGRFLRRTCFALAHKAKPAEATRSGPVPTLQRTRELRKYIHLLPTVHSASAAALSFPAQAAGLTGARNSLCSAA